MLKRADKAVLVMTGIAVLVMGITAFRLLPRYNMLDYIFLTSLLLALSLIGMKWDLPTYAYGVLCLHFFLHGLGVLGSFNEPLFGIFSYSTLHFGLGYDKYTHFYGGIAGALFFHALLPRKGWKTLTLAFILLMAAGSVIEISEYVGSTHFNIGKGGFVTRGDGLPPSENPLRHYDTEFDLVFNAVGGLLGLLIGEVYWRRRELLSKHFSE